MGDDVVIVQKVLCHRAFGNVSVEFERWKSIIDELWRPRIGSLVCRSKEVPFKCNLELMGAR